MPVLLENTEETRGFFTFVEDLLKLERAEVELWLASTNEGLIGIALARRRRDCDGQPYLSFGYRQVLSGHASKLGEVFRQSAPMEKDLEDLLRGTWETVEVEEQSWLYDELPVDVRQLVEVETQLVTGVPRPDLLRALQATGELPPLDVTAEAVVNLTLANTVLNVTRCVGETYFNTLAVRACSIRNTTRS